MVFKFMQKSTDFCAIGIHEAGISYAYRNAQLFEQSIQDCGFYVCQDEADMIQTLTQLKKTFKLNRVVCGTYLDVDDYRLLLIDAPKVPDAEVCEATRWQLMNLIDESVDEVVFDLFELPNHHIHQEMARPVFVVVAQKKAIDTRIALFNRVNINLQVIDIPEMLQRNIAQALAPNQTIMFVSVAADSGLITFTGKNTLYMNRQFGVGIDENTAEVVDSIESVIVEIQRSLDYFERHFGEVNVIELLVLTIAAPHDMLLKYLKRYMPIACHAADLSKIESINQMSLNQAELPGLMKSCFFTLGAALRT